MGGWGLALSAGSFWCGLLCWDLRPPVARGWEWWVWVLFGAVALCAAWLASPRLRTADPLAAARLVAPTPAAVEAVAHPRVETTRAPLAALALLTVALVALGVGWGGLAEARRESSLLGRLAPRGVTLEGTLREDASPTSYGWRAVVDVTQVSWSGGAAAVRETVWVGGKGDPPSAVRGDAVRLRGSLALPDDPGFAEALRHRGIAVSVRAIALERLGPNPNPFVHATQVIRAFVARTIDRIFPPREAGLLLGLALGDASQLDPVTSRDFQTTGLGHLLVVSGENVAMVLAPVLAFASMLRLARVGKVLLGLGIVVLFVVLTGAEPSVLRAGAMATMSLLGVLLGKPRATGVVLAGAVLVLLVLDPWLVHAIGFQLSVAATAGMVTLASSISERLQRFCPKAVALAVGTTIAAQFGVTPLLLFHFHEVPGVTIAANLAAFPAVSPALLLGIAASALGLLWIPAGRAVAFAALLPMRYLETVANVLAKAPVAWITTRGGPLVLLVGFAVFGAVAAWLRSGWRPPRTAVVASIVCLPLVIWTSALHGGAPSGLTLRFLDIGQGDSILITSPAGATVLVDGGPDEELDAQLLASYGVKRLDAVFASHPHADHIAGLPQVVARVAVSAFYEPGCPDDTELQSALHQELFAEDIPVRSAHAGDTIVVGDLTFRVLSPDRCWVDSHSDPNNDSIVMELIYFDDTVLLSGDAEREAQQVMLDTGVLPDVDVLKMPHHGGDTSLAEFFPAVRPELIAIQVGQPNPYGHPDPTALAEAEATGAAIWRTDEHGTLTITWDSRGDPVVSGER
ncbi:MAG: DNA internalization-related competence protein ComEC/Rec2 [Actinomycetota bacterium]